VKGSPGSEAIHVPAEIAKSKKSRRIPLHPSASAVLDEIGRRAKGRVFLGTTGNPLEESSIRKAIKTACRKAGVGEFSTHAMRRTFGRWAVLGQGPWDGKPIPVYVVSKILGHSSISITMAYLDLDENAADKWIAGP
jgi:integrase